MAANGLSRVVVVALLSLTVIGCVAAQPTPVSGDEVVVNNPAAVWVGRVRKALLVYDTTLAAAGDARRGNLITQAQFDAILETAATVQDAGNAALATLSVYLALPTTQGTAEVEGKVANTEQLAVALTAAWRAIDNGDKD